MIDDKNLQQEMGEVAALPPSDPRRRDLELRLTEHPSSTIEQWRDLLLENDSFRDHLSKVDIPQDLENRLVAVAKVASPRRRVMARLGWVLVAAAAATLMLSTQLMSRYKASARMRTVALLAINNHLNHLENHAVDMKATEKKELERALSTMVGFQVVVPALGNGLELAGGRKCKLGTHTVAFTLWSDFAGDYSLFQFQTDRFGLPTTIQPKLVRSTQPAGAEHPCGAWIWTEGAYGYVLTGDPGIHMQRLSPRVGTVETK
jgi:hypothetical protein